jgi:hypothetical protein
LKTPITTENPDIFIIVEDETDKEDFIEKLSGEKTIGEVKVETEKEFKSYYNVYGNKINLLKAYEEFFMEDTLDQGKMKEFLGKHFQKKKN